MILIQQPNQTLKKSLPQKSRNGESYHKSPTKHQANVKFSEPDSINIENYAQITTRVNELTLQLERFEEIIKKQNAQILSLIDENALLQQQISPSKSDDEKVQIYQYRIQQLEARLQKKGVDSEDKQKIKKLEDQISFMNREQAKLTHKFRQREEEVGLLTNQLQELSDLVSERNSNVKNNQNLKQENDQLKYQIKLLQDAFKKQTDELEQKIQLVLTENQSLQLSQSKPVSRMESFKDFLIFLKEKSTDANEIQVWANQNFQLKEQFQFTLSEFELLRERFEDLTKHYKNQMDKLLFAQKEIADRDDLLRNESANALQHVNEVQKVKDQNLQLENENRLLKIQNKKLNDEIETLYERVHEVNESLQKKQSIIDGLTAKYLSLQNNLNEKSNVIKEIKTQLQKSVSVNDLTDRENKQLQKQVQKLTKERAIVIKDFGQKNKDFAQKIDNVESLKKQLSNMIETLQNQVK